MSSNPGGLGRVIIPDERDKDFPLRTLIPEEPPLPRHRYWWDRGWWGDQGRTPQCVAFSWLHYVEDGPVTQAPRAPGVGPVVSPAALYLEAQRIDEWPGENYDGTSVRAGAKALQARGLISGYRWAWNLDDLREAVLLLGPVVVGTWWYEGMDELDSQGFIQPQGRRRGGHAYILNGANDLRGVFRVKNSWGRGWGRRGRAWISYEDMEDLLQEDGEICIAERLSEDP